MQQFAFEVGDDAAESAVELFILDGLLGVVCIPNGTGEDRKIFLGRAKLRRSLAKCLGEH